MLRKFRGAQRRGWWRVAAVVVVIAVVAGVRAARPKASGAMLRAVEAERRDLVLTRTATGLVRPRNRVEVKPPIAGRIDEVLVNEGDAVSQGQTLAWMSSAERAALLDAARSQGEAEVARWETVYKPAPLVAPLDGTVIVRAVEPGQTVATGDPVVVIADHLAVTAQVDETDVGYIRVGQRAEITLDAYPNEEITGEVEHVAYEAQTVNNVTIYEVDVRPDEVPDVMRSGMTASVSVIVDERRDVVTVPSDAVRQDGEGSSVEVAARGMGRPSRRAVGTGLSDGKWVEVTEGLEAGERVMVQMLQMPKGGGGSSPLSPFGQRRRQNR